MKIYTRRGDQGETSLFGGSRVKKDHPRIKVYGAVDELNSLIGLLLTEIKGDKERETLHQVQKNLLCVGTKLATPDEEKGGPTLKQDQIDKLESTIDNWETKLEPLKSFILPGGTKAASLCHMARTACRCTERKVVKLSKSESIPPEILKYINRLSDFFFMMARWCNAEAGHPEILWEGMKKRKDS